MSEVSKICMNCVHFRSDLSSDVEHFDFKDGDCLLLSDFYKMKMKRVRRGDSCNAFEARKVVNPEDVGYKSGGCYLTSACVGYLGKPDDCEELTVLRSFRDNFMKHSEKYAPLVDEYYKIAPGIVEKIDASAERDEYYAYIYDAICRSIRLIDDGRNEEAIAEYRKMTEYLAGRLQPA